MEFIKLPILSFAQQNMSQTITDNRYSLLKLHCGYGKDYALTGMCANKRILPVTFLNDIKRHEPYLFKWLLFLTVCHNCFSFTVKVKTGRWLF